MKTPASASWRVVKAGARSERGIVAAQCSIAGRIGAQVLREGGNAVDAAIAISFASGVAEPWMSGIGGGGHMLVWPAGEETVRHFGGAMRAPLGLERRDYPLEEGRASDLFPWRKVRGDANFVGASAVAVPGLVAMLGAAHEAMASRPWAELIEPSIALCAEGVELDWHAAVMIASEARLLARDPTARRWFLEPDGYPRRASWTALDPKGVFAPLALARSLRQIAEDGPSALYRGSLGAALIDDLRAAGGRHERADLERYAARLDRVEPRAHRGSRLFPTPGLTAGPTLVRVFERLAQARAPAPGAREPDGEAWAAMAGALVRSIAERLDGMGDVDGASCTTNFAVIDRAGTMAAVTQTLVSGFGARIASPQTGVLLNNGISWFDPEPGGPNALGAGKTCLSNMCSTMLLRDDGARFALAASGGRKILPAVAQLAWRLLDFGADLEEAFDAPRLDASIEGALILDDRLGEEVRSALEPLGARIVARRSGPHPFHFACPTGVGCLGGLRIGASQPSAPWADAISE